MSAKTTAVGWQKFWKLPGVLVYGQTSDEAIAKAQALALRAVADRLEHAEGTPEFINIHFAAA
ncbi:MAG: type II toxin-antitoxin system HicB family antitoxin [Pyrinomonadaceae bacterium]